MLICATGCSTAVQASDAPQCADSPAHRSLAFSIGSWSIAAPNGVSEGTSTIRYDLDKCAVIEEWKAPHDRGRNMDAYSADDRQWHRLFVDAQGRVHIFSGTSQGRALTYRGTSIDAVGHVELNRLTIRSAGRDAMTQLWQKSRDNGASWKTVFEGRYTRT